MDRDLLATRGWCSVKARGTWVQRGVSVWRRYVFVENNPTCHDSDSSRIGLLRWRVGRRPGPCQILRSTLQLVWRLHRHQCRIGTGLEFLLTKNVILGAEYLHYDFSR